MCYWRCQDAKMPRSQEASFCWVVVCVHLWKDFFCVIVSWLCETMKLLVKLRSKWTHGLKMGAVPTVHIKYSCNNVVMTAECLWVGLWPWWLVSQLVWDHYSLVMLTSPIFPPFGGYLGWNVLMKLGWFIFIIIRSKFFFVKYFHLWPNIFQTIQESFSLALRQQQQQHDEGFNLNFSPLAKASSQKIWVTL